MKKSLTKEFVEDIANEMGVHPSFIEKDFFAVKVIAEASKFECLDKQLVFSGGTSLSKGFALIQRFSEDLDFKINRSGNLTVGERRKIRHAFRDLVKKIDGLEILKCETADGGKKETIDVKYPQLFSIPENLRQTLQIELFFDEEDNTTEERVINSFISQYTGEKENARILCNQPLNIAADKFNAITWRIYNEGETIDYKLMRHLHDFCAISAYIKDKEKFKIDVLDNFAKKDRARVKANIAFEYILKETLNRLKNSKKYKDGYIKFVDSMSYAPDNERISFEDALGCFSEFSKLF